MFAGNTIPTCVVVQHENVRKKKPRSRNKSKFVVLNTRRTEQRNINSETRRFNFYQLTGTVN